MNAAVLFLPFAKSAAEVGVAALQQAGESLLAGGASFAQMLAGTGEDDEKAKKIEEGVDQPGDATAMLNLVDQIQNGLQSILQSMGLQLDGDLNLSIGQDGKVAVGGDSDSAAVLEQIINSDPALQAKCAALTRACKASGEADQLKAKLRYQSGQVQLQVEQPADDTTAGDATTDQSLIAA